MVGTGTGTSGPTERATGRMIFDSSACSTRGPCHRVGTRPHVRCRLGRPRRPRRPAARHGRRPRPPTAARRAGPWQRGSRDRGRTARRPRHPGVNTRRYLYAGEDPHACALFALPEDVFQAAPALAVLTVSFGRPLPRARPSSPWPARRAGSPTPLEEYGERPLRMRPSGQYVGKGPPRALPGSAAAPAPRATTPPNPTSGPYAPLVGRVRTPSARPEFARGELRLGSPL